VLLAALGVWAMQSRWPDLAVGAALALLLLVSAQRVVRDAWSILRITSSEDRPNRSHERAPRAG